MARCYAVAIQVNLLENWASAIGEMPLMAIARTAMRTRLGGAVTESYPQPLHYPPDSTDHRIGLYRRDSDLSPGLYRQS
jgi:hypothetical protein